MHDRNGTPLQKGDVVLIVARVRETWASEDYCNLGLDIGFEKEHGPDNVQGSLTVNARQVLLYRR